MRTSIFDIENWREIWATLSRNKTRTFLTGFGIFWGVAMLAILSGGSRGGEDILRRNFDSFATNSGFIIPSRTTIPYNGHAKDRQWWPDLTDIEAMRRAFPQLETVTPLNQMNTSSISSDNKSYSGGIWMVEPDFAKVNRPKIYAGRYINEADLAKGRRVVALGKKIANEIFPDDPSPLGKTVRINGVNFTLVGITGQEQTTVNFGGDLNQVAQIPFTTGRTIFNIGEEVGMIWFVARPGQRVGPLQDRMIRMLYRRHGVAPDDTAASWFLDISENFAMVDNLFLGVSLLALFIGGSTLLAGVIGIGNIMWVIVKERTQEIGVRRALGARPSDIITQVLSEGLALTAAAGAAGILFATVALGVTQRLTTEPGFAVPRFQMTPSGAIEIILVFIVLGTLAGVVPAIKAMRIKPIEALNDK